MTFNEWWAGQNLPEDTKAVALAAWYAHQLYGERIVQPVTAGDSLTAALPMAHGHQLDTFGTMLKVTRVNGESDQAYRERLLLRHREVVRLDHDSMITRFAACDHSWSMIHHPVFGQECERCGMLR